MNKLANWLLKKCILIYPKQHFGLALFSTITTVWTSACVGTPIVEVDTHNTAPKITSKMLPEISGFASSELKPGQIWVINDSGNSANIYRVGKNLQVKQTVKLAIRNRDWEDLATFREDGVSWIIVADTGDNQHQYKQYFLYLFREDQLLNANDKIINPDKTIEFSYINGSQNCEAIAIDPVRLEAILINKKDKNAPTAYRLSLTQKKPNIATIIAELKQFSKRSSFTKLAKRFTGVNLDAVTAMDISSNGMFALVLTYKSIWLYEKSKKTSWSSTFSRPAKIVANHTLPQAESLSIDLNQQSVTISSEKLPAPVIKIDLDRLITESN